MNKMSWQEDIWNKKKTPFRYTTNEPTEEKPAFYYIDKKGKKVRK